MVKIRLARHGARHRPFYHITVADKRARRDGSFIERIGFYNPIASGGEVRRQVDLERIDYWVSVGARLSPRVKQLVKEARRDLRNKPAIADEESVEAAAEDAPAAEAVAAETEEETVAAAEDVEQKVDTEAEVVADAAETTTEAQAETTKDADD